jgi:phage tail P2-like protein
MNNSLMPTGSSLVERRLAVACADASNLNVPLRDLWDPWKCPAKFLPYLAWAFSVDRWDETWTESEKRQEISDAFWIHQRKGTVAALRRVIEKMGYAISVTEWWEVADPAGTFRLAVDLNDIGITYDMLKDLERLIEETKPVSRHLAQLNMTATITGNILAGAAHCIGEVITVYPVEYEAQSDIRYNGVISHDGNIEYR